MSIESEIHSKIRKSTFFYFLNLKNFQQTVPLFKKKRYLAKLHSKKIRC